MAREWQPIETAPKDGSDILLFSPDAREPGVFLGSWATWEYAPGTPASVIGGAPEPGWIDSWTDQDIDTWPTHWMPLPEAPAA